MKTLQSIAGHMADLFMSDEAAGTALMEISVPVSLLLPSKANVETAGMSRGRPLIDFMSVLNGFAFTYGGNAISFDRSGFRQLVAAPFSFRMPDMMSCTAPDFDIDRVASYLQKLAALDLAAMYMLMQTRIPCNDTMAMRPDIDVKIADPANGASVSLLGVLNCVLGHGGADAQRKIAINVEDTGLGIGEFTGFCIVDCGEQHAALARVRTAIAANYMLRDYSMGCKTVDLVVKPVTEKT